MSDGRNWINGQAAYLPQIAIWFVLPDEYDLLEVGLRPALAYIKASLPDGGIHGGLALYRSSAA